MTYSQVRKPVKKSKKAGMIGFYKRKAIFFVVLLVSAIYGINLYSSNNFSADTLDLVGEQNSSYREFNVDVLENGSVKINGEKTSQTVDLFSQYDELRLLVLDQPGEYYNQVKIFLSLPSGEASNVKTEFLAIHGVGDTDTSIQSDGRILYEATTVSANATLTIVAKIPKGTISPTVSMMMASYIKGLKGSVWVVIGIGVPGIIVLYMVGLLAYMKRRQKIDVPTKESNVPPMAIPPAIVGVLFNQKVTSREIAATLIDLAQRGDIIILDEERGFSFGKGRFDQRLLGYEKMLLSKIFRNNLSSDRQEIDRRINNHFYSKKISLVSSGIYALSTRLGYFKVNPQKTHAKFRLVGASFFALGLLGFITSLMVLKEPSYLIFCWVGMMASAIIITFVAGYLPNRTVIGQEVASNWLAFRKYLSNPNPMIFTEYNQELFQKYLPYAIVLNCEAAWAKRFSNHNFVTPEWFLSEKNGLGLDDFCLSLFPIVSYVGRSLSALKEPGFE